MSSDPRIWCLGSSYVRDLKADLESPETLEEYRGCGRELDPARFLETGVVGSGNQPELLDSTGGATTQSDGDCAVKLHRYLSGLSRAQAAEERLWACLAHTRFHDYCRERWLTGADRNLKATVMNRWFMAGGRTGIVRNALARLWWGAELTRAPWEIAPELKSFGRDGEGEYFYTKWFFCTQNMCQGLLHRGYTGSLRLRICLLEAFARHAEGYSNLSALSEAVQKRVNLISAYRALDALKLDALVDLMEEQVRREIDLAMGEPS